MFNAALLGCDVSFGSPSTGGGGIINTGGGGGLTDTIGTLCTVCGLAIDFGGLIGAGGFGATSTGGSGGGGGNTGGAGDGQASRAQGVGVRDRRRRLVQRDGFFHERGAGERGGAGDPERGSHRHRGRRGERVGHRRGVQGREGPGR